VTYSGFPVAAVDLDAEDVKIVRLARVARQRAYVPRTGLGQGAAARDTDGRTYAAATVEHTDPDLSTSAVRGVLSAALSSGARTFEALVVLPAAGLDATDSALIAEFAGGAPVLLADAQGAVVGVVHP
jgi:cytidine deaminase